jgi:iron only hydrogenase large subunit-like protein
MFLKAHKDEISRPQLTMDVQSAETGATKKIQETDYVLTTRELGHLIQNENISFVSLPER